MEKKIIMTSSKAPQLEDAAKKQIVKDGWYYTILGAFNCVNSAGHFYIATPRLIKSFENMSAEIFTAMENGQLRSENGHPSMMPGETVQAFLNRNALIDEKNTIASIKGVELIYTGQKSPVPGRELILIKGWVKPSGVHGHILQKEFDDPEMNVCFSIRSFLNPNKRFIQGMLVREITEIIAFDKVNEPGIVHANQWKQLGIENKNGFAVMETIELISFDASDMYEEDGSIKGCVNCGIENKHQSIYSTISRVLTDTVSVTPSVDQPTITTSKLSKW